MSSITWTTFAKVQRDKLHRNGANLVRFAEVLGHIKLVVVVAVKIRVTESINTDSFHCGEKVSLGGYHHYSGSPRKHYQSLLPQNNTSLLLKNSWHLKQRGVSPHLSGAVCVCLRKTKTAVESEVAGGDVGFGCMGSRWLVGDFTLAKKYMEECEVVYLGFPPLPAQHGSLQENNLFGGQTPVAEGWGESKGRENQWKM